jgi:tripartite-type tricarboxylate transporter receptor subunit TctC
MGQTVVIENRAGAGTTIGAAMVAKAEADGYTILANSNAHTVNPQLYRSLPYDSATDFVGIATLGSLPNILVVSPQSPFNSVQELVAAARSQPGKLNYASAGVGSGTHMNAEKFRIASGLSAEHIAYKGTPEAVTEVMAGRVDWFFAPGVSVMGAVKDRKLKALAVGSKERSSQLPDLPTTEEAGAPNSAYTLWIGLFAPARTPPAIVARLNQEVQAALASPEVKERFSKLGADPLPMTVDGFRNFLAQEFKVSEQIVKAAGIKPQD